MQDALASLAGTAERPHDFFSLCDDAMPSLRRLAGFDGVCVLALDPVTLLPTAHLDRHGIPSERGARLMELEYGGDDVGSFADLAAERRTAYDLHEETGGRPWSSRRWEEVLEPSDRPHEARVLLADGQEVWGGVCLFRGADGRPFTPQELERLRAAAPVLARGIRLAVLAAALRRGEQADPGVLVFGPDARLQAMTGAADQWLADVPDTMSPSGLPVQLVALVHRTLAAPEGSPPVRATVPVRGGGWATLHADRLGDGVSVVVEQARRDRLVEVIARAYGLTPRERDVALLVLRGASTKGMSAQLGLSQWTVQDHLKGIFAKTGTRTRGELSALMLGTDG